MPASARLEAVNRPDLLPKEPGQNVIQIEKFLTSGQVKRLDALTANLEKNTGFRVRILCQAYPQTPGLAIRYVNERLCRCAILPVELFKFSLYVQNLLDFF